MLVLQPRTSVRLATADWADLAGRTHWDWRETAYNSAILFGPPVNPSIHIISNRIVYVPSTLLKIDDVEWLIGWSETTTVIRVQKSSNAVKDLTKFEKWFRCREEDNVDIRACASVCDPHAVLCETILCKQTCGEAHYCPRCRIDRQ